MKYDAFIKGESYSIQYMGTTLIGGKLTSSYAVIRDRFRDEVMYKGTKEACKEWLTKYEIEEGGVE